MVSKLTSRYSSSVVIIIISILILLFLGIITTPQLLIKLGPLRRSLESEFETARHIAYFTVYIFRFTCLLVAVLLLIMLYKWNALLKCKFVKRINSHTVPTRCYEISTKKDIINLSFFVVVSFLALSLLFVMFGGKIFTSEQLRVFTKEDGPIENMTAMFFLLSSVLSLLLSFRIGIRKRRGLVLVVLSFAFLIFCGEEISWGQRLFNIETIEIMKVYNVQHENNIHRLFGSSIMHLFAISVLTYGFIVPILAYCSKFFQKLFDLVGLPVASLGLAIGFLLLSFFQSWTVNLIAEVPPGMRHEVVEELRELGISLAFALLIIESWYVGLDQVAFRNSDCP